MSEIKLYGTLTPGTTNDKIAYSRNVYDKLKNLSQENINKSFEEKIAELQKIDPNLKLVDIVTELPTKNIIYYGLYAVGPTFAEEDTEQIDPLYKLYSHNKVKWTYLGFLNTYKLDIVQEKGDSASVVMSQKAVTDALKPNLLTEDEYKELEKDISDDDDTIYYIYEEEDEEEDVIEEIHPTLPFEGIIPESAQERIWWEGDRIDAADQPLGFYFLDKPLGFFILANIVDMTNYLNNGYGIYVSSMHEELLEYNNALYDTTNKDTLAAKEDVYFRNTQTGAIYLYNNLTKTLIKQVNVELDENNNVIIRK